MLIKMLVFGQDIVHFPFSGSNRWEKFSRGRKGEGLKTEDLRVDRGWSRLQETRSLSICRELGLSLGEGWLSGRRDDPSTVCRCFLHEASHTGIKLPDRIGTPHSTLRWQIVTPLHGQSTWNSHAFR